jgi:quercetin dioxygenase-like cupin family protein
VIQTGAPVAPRHVAASSGRAVRVLGDRVTCKAMAAETGGAYSLFETCTPPGAGCPPHSQRYDEETFYVLEGRYALLLGEQTVELSPGDYAFVPRGTVHAFTNIGSEPARMLILVTPGGIHDTFFDEVGEHPDVAAGEPDIARLLAVAPKYGIEIAPPDGDREAGRPGR